MEPAEHEEHGAAPPDAVLAAPLLNRLALRAGRLPAPGRDDEAVPHAPFAEEQVRYPNDNVEPGTRVEGR